MSKSSELRLHRLSPARLPRRDRRCDLAPPGPAEEKERDDIDEEESDGIGLHFVKLRPEPVTGDNIRSLVQVCTPSK